MSDSNRGHTLRLFVACVPLRLKPDYNFDFAIVFEVPSALFINIEAYLKPRSECVLTF